MRRSFSSGCLLAVAFLTLPAFAAAAEKPSKSAATEQAIDFARDVQPVLADKCLNCHGPDKAESGLRLDGREAAMAEAESGERAIIPGNVKSSALLRRIRSDDPDERMPPKGESLTAAEIDRIEQWIAAGAKWTLHWSYRPVERPRPPAQQKPDWAGNAIDNFVLARLATAGIAPSPEADRYTLIKRLYLDLIGLPPGPAEVDAFVNSKSPQAYEQLVDRLLASEHFGERWGRHWLDKARYADTDGYEKDRPRPNAWRYRDWVIAAINADMPFDQFTIEQLAGDLLPDATPLQRLATAFHRQTLTNTEGGADQEQFRVEAIFDRVETTGTVWLGLTVGCARCHSHKYDQISQREYYEMFAFFNNGGEANTEVPKDDPRKYASAVAEADAKVHSLNEQLQQRKDEIAADSSAAEEQLQERISSDAAQPLQYHPLELLETTGPQGVNFERQNDRSYLVAGTLPDQAKYTVEAATTLENITGVRLEVLADQRLPKKGPGWSDNGNFVLSEIRLYASTKDKLAATDRIALKTAEADFSQKDWPVSQAISSDLKKGWAVSPQFGKDHAATFFTDKPISLGKKTRLQIVLDQQHGQRHLIGRFRLSVVTGRQPSVPASLQAILAIAPQDRNDRQRDELLAALVAHDAAARELNANIADLGKRRPQPPKMNVRVIAHSPRKTRLLHRGDFLSPEKEVQPGTLGTLHTFQSRHQQGTADRLDFARWLVAPENPLTSRVTVNQLWRNLFGAGLVRTAVDFGVRGEPPTHPQLLDWLASELIHRGWSRKTMIKQIVMSATYRQSSHHRPESAAVDPENRLFHRQNRFRVEGEIVRDVYLSIAGLLSPKVGGPSVFPPMPPDVASLSYANNFKWNTSEGEDRYRRGMYTFFKRTAPHPNLTTFDCPDGNTTKVKREISNSPLQPLALLNNMTYVEAARALARRLLTSALDNDRERLDLGYRLCATRPPAEVERKRFQSLLELSRKWYGEHRDDAPQLVDSYGVEGVEMEEVAAWVATSRILLNLDATITRE